MAKPLQNIFVLVADDAPVNLLIITQVLTDAGATVYTANNGKQVLQKLEEQGFDIILMDLQMPELDGFETTRAIRVCSSNYCNIPIIAVTSETAQIEIDKSVEAGMNDYITKPFISQIIIKKILSLLQATPLLNVVSDDIPNIDLQDFN